MTAGHIICNAHNYFLYIGHSHRFHFKKGESKFAVIERFSFMELKARTLLQKIIPVICRNSIAQNITGLSLKQLSFLNSPSFYFKREGIETRSVIHNRCRLTRGLNENGTFRKYFEQEIKLFGVFSFQILMKPFLSPAQNSQPRRYHNHEPHLKFDSLCIKTSIQYNFH